MQKKGFAASGPMGRLLYVIRTFLFFLLVAVSSCVDGLQPTTRVADELIKSDLIVLVTKVSGKIHCYEVAVTEVDCEKNEYQKNIREYNTGVPYGSFLVVSVIKGDVKIFSKIHLSEGVEEALDWTLLAHKYLFFAERVSDGSYFVHPCEVIEVDDQDINEITGISFSRFKIWVEENDIAKRCRSLKLEWN